MKYSKAAAPRESSTPRYGNADEARLVRRLIRFLAARNFQVHSLAIDGEYVYVRTKTERAAVCEIFEWDAKVTLRFVRVPDVDGTLFGVLLIQGNGPDMISDYTYDSAGLSDPKPGTFAAAMFDFQKLDEARDV